MNADDLVPDGEVLVIGPAQVGKTVLIQQLRRLCNELDLMHGDSHDVASSKKTRSKKAEAALEVERRNMHVDKSPSATVGMELEHLRHNDIHIVVKEIGSAISSTWSSYIRQCHLLVFVIDVSHRTQISETCVQLMSAVRQIELQRERPILIVLNKQDMPKKMGTHELQDLLRLGDLVASNPRYIDVYEMSAMTGRGVKPLLVSIFRHIHQMRDDIADDNSRRALSSHDFFYKPSEDQDEIGVFAGSQEDEDGAGGGAGTTYDMPAPRIKHSKSS